MIEKTYPDSPSAAFNRIAKGLKAFRESTEGFVALIVEAKEREIWKLKYSTLQEFCDKECGISRAWLFALCDTSKTIQEIAAVSGNGSPPIPATILKNLTPQQAAPLKGLPATAKAAVLSSAIARSGGGNPAPRTIQAEANNRAKTAAVDIVLDTTGYPVPSRALPFWNRSQEVQDVLTILSRVKGILQKAEQDKDLMWGEINFSTVIPDLSKVWTHIQTAKPYAVCPYCQGMKPDTCSFCKGRGVVSHYRWGMVPSELKTVRSKATVK